MKNEPEFTYWFEKLDRVEPNGNTEIVIPPLPEGIHGVSSMALLYCQEVESIVFPEGMTALSIHSPKYCRSLKKAVFPSSLKHISKQLFEELDALETVIISEGTEDIGMGAFRNCSALKTVVLPSTLKTIGGTAFDGCVSLECLTIPKGIETLGANAFKNCPRLTLSFEDGMPEEKKAEISALLPNEYTVYEVCDSDAEGAERLEWNGCWPYASDGSITIRKVTLSREKFLELFYKTKDYYITEKNSTHPIDPEDRRVRPEEAVFQYGEFFGIRSEYYDRGEWSDSSYEVIREPSVTPLVIDINAGFVRTASSYLCGIMKRAQEQ